MSLPALQEAQQPASLLRRVLLQGKYEAVTMLRNGEQLILAVVLPLLALVGLTVTPFLDGMGSSRINAATECSGSCPPRHWAAVA
jgi:ABC-2 type transport system permease protein